jgi:hypothetical protein
MLLGYWVEMGVVTDFTISQCKEGQTGVNSAPHRGKPNSASLENALEPLTAPGGSREIINEMMVLD